MSTNHDSIDQAEILRKRMEENHSETTELPPRSEVHRKKDKKVKFRVRFPLIRLLALSFILIVCIVASYNLWKDHIQLTNASETGNEDKKDSNIDVVEIKDREEEGAGLVEKVQKDEEKVAQQAEEKEEEEQDQVEAVQPTDTTPAPIDKTSTEVEVQEATPVPNTTTEQVNKNEPTKVLHHRVKAGETLYRISMRYYKSRAGEEIIKKTNGLDANGTVMTGQILKIPLK